jgi:cell division protein FtsB
MAAAVPAHDAKRATKATLRVVGMLSAVLTLVFLISFVFSEKGIAELQSSRRRVSALRSDIQRLTDANRELRAEIESLHRSTFAVEKIAREDLSLSRPGEIIYMLPRQPQRSPLQR